MTQYELIRRVIENKSETYPVPKLPPANPDDFYTFRGQEELEAVLEDMRRRASEGSDTSMAAQLDEAGFGSAGVM